MLYVSYWGHGSTYLEADCTRKVVIRLEETTESTEATGSESTETQESQGEDTSTKDTQDKTYRVDGRDISADELFDKHSALGKDYSRKSNRLAELEKSYEGGAQTERAAKAATQDVDPAISEYVLSVVRPELDKIDQNRRAVEALDRSFDKIASTWDGKDGKPKYDSESGRAELFDYISKPGSKVFDPEIAFEILHKEEIRDWEISQALKKQKGGVRTERTGSSTERKPKRKQAKSLREASDMFLARQNE